MPKHDGEFIPHSHCTVASGDCFHASRCLAQCTARKKAGHEKRINDLERKVNQLTNALIRHGIKL